jgi:hypothetical protein
MRRRMISRFSLTAGVAAVAICGSVAMAPVGNAVTGCNAWAASDGRAYSQCSSGSGQQRAAASCTVAGLYVGTAYGQWVTSGKVSVASCSFPQRIDIRNGRAVVWWETRA